MKIRILLLTLLVSQALGQTVYQRCQSFVAQNKDRARLIELGTTAGKQPLYVVALSRGTQPDSLPALCIVAGTHRDYAYTAELALRLLPELAKSPALEGRTIYVVPEASPAELALTQDASLSQNGRPYDDDRDARTDEDPADDLNGDGKIVWMRIADPAGPWVAHPRDSRVLLPWQKVLEAGLTPGARYRLAPEGKDNDGDTQLNEDGVGGVAFERNWSHSYEWFKPGSGPHAVSEPETRTLADFLFAHYNVHTVLILGPAHNLSTPWEAAPAPESIPTKIHKDDKPYYDWLARLYGQQVKQALRPTPVAGGGILSWAHYHYGRFAIGTPGWQFPTLKDTANKALQTDDYLYLKWADSLKLKPHAAWTEVQHPDLKATVAIGGLLPAQLATPPADSMDVIASRHSRFAEQVLRALPTLAATHELKSLGNGLYELKIKLSNSGALPTHTSLGSNFKFTKAVTARATLAKGQTLVAGKPVTILGPLAPAAQHELTYLVQGSGSFAVVLYTPSAGRQVVQVELK